MNRATRNAIIEALCRAMLELTGLPEHATYQFRPLTFKGQGNFRYSVSIATIHSEERFEVQVKGPVLNGQ